MLITMTNVCFVEAKSFELGHGNGDRLTRTFHADLMVEIISVFKGLFDIVMTRLGLSAIWS